MRRRIKKSSKDILRQEFNEEKKRFELDFNKDLDTYLQSYDLEYFVNYLISLQYKGEDTYLISEYALNYLFKIDNISDKKPSFVNYMIVYEEFKKIFFEKNFINLKNFIEENKNNNEKEIKTSLIPLTMQLNRDYARGIGYKNQLLDLANRIYAPFDNDFINALGFKYTTFEKMIIYIYNEYKKNKFRILDFKVNKQTLYTEFGKNEVDSIFSETAIKFNEHIETDLNIFYLKPFIDCGEYIYAPLAINNLYNIPKFFHYYFMGSDSVFNKNVRSEYGDIRGKSIEKKTYEILGKLFNTNCINNEIYCKDGKDKYESDFLVQYDSTSIALECKAKIYKKASSDGIMDDILTDVDDIKKAYMQGSRTLNFVDNGFVFYSDKECENIIKTKKTNNNYVICVCFDDFSNIAYNYEDFHVLGEYCPIIINIYDLEIIAIETKTPKRFIEYLQFRVDNFKYVHSNDELEVLGAFLKNVKNFGETSVPIGYKNHINKKYERIAEKFIENYNI